MNPFVKQSEQRKQQRLDNGQTEKNKTENSKVPKESPDEVLLPAPDRSLRRLPRLVLRSIKLVREAAPREFITAALLQLTAGAAVAVQLLVAREVLSSVLAMTPGDSIGRVVPYLVVLALVSALILFADVARNEQQRILADLVARHTIQQVIRVATAVDLLAYESPEFHDRLQRAQVNASVRPLQMATGVLGIVSSAFALGGIAFALLVVEPLLLGLALLGYFPAWVASKRAGRLTYEFFRRQTERDRRRAYLVQLLCGKDEAKEIRGFGLGPFLSSLHDLLFGERISDLRQVVARRLRLWVAASFITSFVTVMTIVVLVAFVASGRMSVAAAGTAAGGILLLAQRLKDLASSAASLYESSLFVEDFSTFVDSMPAITETRPTRTPPARFSNLTAEAVSFTYPNSPLPSLQEVSLEIGATEVVALVGENGSGKTTLAKILAGLYAPHGGTVTWDGVDIASWDPDQLRRSVAVIFQDFAKYLLTARENIGMGRYERLQDLEGIVEAARCSGADEVIRQLPQGYDTSLGPQFFGGTDLSIGEWQRVALARMFFRDAPFIILDEPTSALDPRAEAELFETIRTLCYGRSVLFISHRFSSVRTADRIYVLHQGRVVEEGTHEDLLAQGGRYAHLFRLQASTYFDGPPDQGEVP